jgi:hypothetical protein
VATNKITLTGRLSVVTYLYLFVLATGANWLAALAASRRLFRHFFPRSYAGCRNEGGLLVRG